MTTPDEAIKNPLMNLYPPQPSLTPCPTGWDSLPLWQGGYRDHSALSVQAAEVIRAVQRPDGPHAVSRLYWPTGHVAGLYADDGKRRMLPRTGNRGKVMADLGGVAMMRGRVPWGTSGPVELPLESPFRRLGLFHYPYSVISRVLITAGGPNELLLAMQTVSRPDVIREYMGIPVLCLPPLPKGDGPDAGGLESVRWPDGVILTVTDPALEDCVSGAVFDLETEVVSFYC